MAKDVLSQVAYDRVKREVKAAGSVTHVGEQRLRRREGIHPLVDPKAYDLIRRSLPRFEQVGDYLLLPMGEPMLIEWRGDTTGSMGGNIDLMFEMLPIRYDLLNRRVLHRYDLQLLNGTFQDFTDKVVVYRSQAEMGEKIPQQLTYMFPERDGNDFEEDPQISLFGGAFLTAAAINRYGLKYYDSSLGDAPGRDVLDAAVLERVYGPSVWEKVALNGFQIDKNNLPTAAEIGQELQKRAHSFFYQIGDHPQTTSYWKKVLGKDRVVKVPHMALYPYLEAVVIGLTEGVIDLQTIADFLREENPDINKTDVGLIKKYVSHIPIGAQAALPNFNKIPLLGAKFASKGDLWPIEAGATEDLGSDVDSLAPEDQKGEMWL